MDTVLPLPSRALAPRFPSIDYRPRPELGIPGTQPSRWVTREKPEVERIACPWLIRRFLDAEAEFHFVPADQVAAAARRLPATPFDVPGAEISHAWERCSFDALLSAFDLDLPALDTLATIVRGADTDRLRIAPQAAGLLAMSQGLSMMYEKDEDKLEAGMLFYDALYAWCLLAPGKRHGWAAHEA